MRQRQNEIARVHMNAREKKNTIIPLLIWYISVTGGPIVPKLCVNLVIGPQDQSFESVRSGKIRKKKNVYAVLNLLSN